MPFLLLQGVITFIYATALDWIMEIDNSATSAASFIIVIMTRAKGVL